ncbi:MAG TPA: hypothetical protein VGJ00_03460 [Rhabdochlamydiaceae bacterium]|jgi:hypothetical protein
MRFYFLLILSISLCCHAQEAPAGKEVLRYAEIHLPHWGILKERNGFVFVAIDAGYIYKLIHFISDEGFEEPPYFGLPDSAGAHITVIYPNEVEKYHLGKIKECGKRIYFTLQECQVVHPLKLAEVEELYLITVDVPELEKIRKKYGLPPAEYPFHITIGFKYKAGKAA